MNDACDPRQISLFDTAHKDPEVLPAPSHLGGSALGGLGKEHRPSKPELVGSGPRGSLGYDPGTNGDFGVDRASTKRLGVGQAPEKGNLDRSGLYIMYNNEPNHMIRAPAFGDLRALATVAGPDSLPFWATHYLEAAAYGGSPHTLDAKSRDLKSFVAWFHQATGTLDVRGWRVRDTRSYLGYLSGKRLAPTTINRHFATLRHFARWAHDEHTLFGNMGLPTRGVEETPVDEAPCKKLDAHEVRALFKAAEDRVILLDAKRAVALEDGGKDPTRRARPRRDLAMFGLLYYTGLRASELVMLRRDQYTGTHLLDVARKGSGVTRRVYVPKDARRLLDDYLHIERGRDEPDGGAVPLFLTSQSGGYLAREQLNEALVRIADEANKHRLSDAPIHLHPHRLRHTFGARHREASSSDSETAAALGHKSNKYVGRYARKTDDERDALIEAAMDV